jgi:phage repressor protein C with HTH and peptisase S24 domain
MAPTLQSGDYVLTYPAYIWPARRLKAGRVYIIDHSDMGRIIKRLMRELEDGRLVFAGDNPVSNSGDILGRIEKTRITARAFLHISAKRISLI